MHNMHVICVDNLLLIQSSAKIAILLHVLNALNNINKNLEIINALYVGKMSQVKIMILMMKDNNKKYVAKINYVKLLNKKLN